MIERLAATDIPVQLRSTLNEGANINPTNSVEKVNARNPIDQKHSAPEDPKKQKEKMEEIVKGLNDFLKPAHTSVKFKLHEKLNKYYVVITDDITDQVIKEIPAKKLLDTYAAMAEHLGILVDKKI